MNPLTNMKNVVKLSEQELYTSNKTSWHDQYKSSAWIFVGGLPYDLTEGDIICVFSQYGEIVNINLIRDKDTGKPKGFCFICYEDQRSTVLAVDNFNGIKILNRIIRVDHVNEYKVPKDGKKTDEETKKLYEEGCAPKPQTIEEKKFIKPKTDDKKLDPYDLRETLADQIATDIKLPARLPIYPIKQENIKTEDNKEKTTKNKKEKKRKKDKKNKKKKSKKNETTTDEDSSDSSHSESQEKKHKKKKRRKKKVSSTDESSSSEDEEVEKKSLKKNRKKDDTKNKSTEKIEDNSKKSWDNPERRRRSVSVEINKRYRNPSVEKPFNNYKSSSSSSRPYEKYDKYSTYQRSPNYYNQNRRR